MLRHLAILVAGFLVGALLMTLGRAALHRPYGEAGRQEAAASHALPPSAPAAVPAATAATVNTLCPICGMAVDPRLPTAVYEGRTIGFGCRACPATFAEEPGRYGAAALADRVVED